MFTCSRIELIELLADFAGYKAGLALSRAQLEGHLTEYRETLVGDDDDGVRIRYEVLDAMVGDLLFALGTLTRRRNLDPAMELYAKYRNDDHLSKIVQCITDEMTSCAMRATLDPELLGKPIDITPIAERAYKEFGSVGFRMYEEFYRLLLEHMEGSFSSAFRHTEWKNIEELTALFEDESLSPLHGTFFDQRFIDYLQRNDASLDSMNWRKFEGLAGEFFKREGFRVAMGKGRADGGVDLRVWRDDLAEDAAPTILVQCKRQKESVSQVVVKALYADVVHEQAESGMIVTTSKLQPGAAAVCSARGYPVHAADRKTLRRWLEQLRTPGSGVLRG